MSPSAQSPDARNRYILHLYFTYYTSRTLSSAPVLSAPHVQSCAPRSAAYCRLQTLRLEAHTCTATYYLAVACGLQTLRVRANLHRSEVHPHDSSHTSHTRTHIHRTTALHMQIDARCISELSPPDPSSSHVSSNTHPLHPASCPSTISEPSPHPLRVHQSSRACMNDRHAASHHRRACIAVSDLVREDLTAHRGERRLRSLHVMRVAHDRSLATHHR